MSLFRTVITNITLHNWTIVHCSSHCQAQFNCTLCTIT